MTDRTDLVDEIAQAIWQVYVAQAGRALPVGMANDMAQAVIDALGLTPETGRWGTEQRWVSLWREVADD